MKKTLFTLLVLLSAQFVIAQVPDTAMRHLMEYRVYDCYEVEYNAVLQSQRLYKQGKRDSLSALITFWKNHCAPNERIVSLSILNSIKNNTFKESLTENEFLAPRSKTTFTDSDIYVRDIFYYLKEYRSAVAGAISDNQYSVWMDNNYALPKDYTEYYKFYKQYYSFLQEMAVSLVGKRAYSPAEEFLIKFYARPDSVAFAELDSVKYEPTVLGRKYVASKNYHNKMHGFSSNIQMGMWLPTGPLSTLGSHPYMAYNLGGRGEVIMADYTFGFRVGDAKNYITVLKDGTYYNSKNYISWFTGADLGCKLFRTRKSELDFLVGLGYEEIQTLYEPVENDVAITQSVKSFYANAGLAYKIYVRNTVRNNKHVRSYFSLQAKYNYVNYDNKGGTDLTGNALIIGLVYGSYTHGYIKHPNLN